MYRTRVIYRILNECLSGSASYKAYSKDGKVTSSHDVTFFR